MILLLENYVCFNRVRNKITGFYCITNDILTSHTAICTYANSSCIVASISDKENLFVYRNLANFYRVYINIVGT